MTAGSPDRCFRQKEAYKRMQEDKTTMEDKKIGYKPLTAAIPFSEFKLNEAGLIPAIVQDDVTGDVLMLAYMNEASYNKTLETGLMTDSAAQGGESLDAVQRANGQTPQPEQTEPVVKRRDKWTLSICEESVS